MMMNQQQVIDKLKAAKGDWNLRDFAEQIGISHSLLALVLNGQRRPGPKILDYMGLQARKTTTVVYVPK